MKIGYARVSTDEQITDLQTDALNGGRPHKSPAIMRGFCVGALSATAEQLSAVAYA
jgi:hypothetical protein